MGVGGVGDRVRGGLLERGVDGDGEGVDVLLGLEGVLVGGVRHDELLRGVGRVHVREREAAVRVRVRVHRVEGRRGRLHRGVAQGVRL